MKSPKSGVIALLILWIFASCTPKTAGQIINEQNRNAYLDSQILKLLFATPRNENKASQEGCSDKYFLTEGRVTDLHFGSCNVNVPMQHSIGEIEAALGNRDQYYQFENYYKLSEDDFWNSLEDSKRILLFVHGFNVRFEEALLRGAQLKYDLKFSDPVVVFTWPSGGKSGLIDQLFMQETYEANLQSARNSRGLFVQFLDKLTSTGKEIYLVVHSMGHQVVLPSISQLSINGDRKKSIQELVLNAPDFDVTEFRRILPDLQKVAKRITLYCSPGDSALYASSQINETGRLGSCMRFQGIDTINVNPIDSSMLSLGHGYYSSRPILTDLFQLLLGVEAPKRLFIRKSKTSESEFTLRN